MCYGFAQSVFTAEPAARETCISFTIFCQGVNLVTICHTIANKVFAIHEQKYNFTYRYKETHNLLIVICSRSLHVPGFI